MRSSSGRSAAAAGTSVSSSTTTFQLHPVGLLLGGSLDYLLEDAPVVLSMWRDLMTNAPDSLASFAQIYRDAVTGEGL